MNKVKKKTPLNLPTKLCHVLQIHIFLQIHIYFLPIDPHVHKLKNILFKTGKIKRYVLKYVTQFLFLVHNNIYSLNINIFHRKLALYPQ